MQTVTIMIGENTGAFTFIILIELIFVAGLVIMIDWLFFENGIAVNQSKFHYLGASQYYFNNSIFSTLQSFAYCCCISLFV